MDMGMVSCCDKHAWCMKGMRPDQMSDPGKDHALHGPGHGYIFIYIFICIYMSLNGIKKSFLHPPRQTCKSYHVYRQENRPVVDDRA